MFELIPFVNTNQSTSQFKLKKLTHTKEKIELISPFQQQVEEASILEKEAMVIK